VEPSLINTDDLYFSEDEYIYFKITNHGWIAANAGRLTLPSNAPSMSFTPLLDPIGDIPGNFIMTLYLYITGYVIIQRIAQ
jgi:hypothetical protein